MSKSSMQVEEISGTRYPISGLRPQGLEAVEAVLLHAESSWAINLYFSVQGCIQFWQVTWLEGDRNLAIITKTRFRFAEYLAPAAKGSLCSPFTSGGISHLRRSRFALDFPRASGARFLGQSPRIESFIKTNDGTDSQTHSAIRSFLTDDLKKTKTKNKQIQQKQLTEF